MVKIGGMTLTKDIAKQLASAIYSQTNDVKFTQTMIRFLDTDEEALQLLSYIIIETPTDTLDIDKKAFEIALPRIAKENEQGEY